MNMSQHFGGYFRADTDKVIYKMDVKIKNKPL